MAKRTSILGISKAARMLSQRVAFAVLGTFAIAILIFSKTQEDGIGKLRLAIADRLAPVFMVLSEPVKAANQALTNANQFWSTYEDNQVLRRDLQQLQHWRSQALTLEKQNQVLAAQLNMMTLTSPRFVTAAVISDSGGPFVHTRLLRAGQISGVAAGQAAVSGGVMVGKIVAAGKNVSRLLLLTDLNARVPVMVERLRVRAISAGDNSDHPRLLHLRETGALKVGDQIVTSGHGGVYPPGLPVGRIDAISKDSVSVRPFVDFSRLEYVSVLQQTLPVIHGPSSAGEVAPSKR